MAANKDIFVQEVGGTLLLFLLFYPTYVIEGGTWTLWTLHFFFVILIDIVTNGSCMNPALAYCFYLDGQMKKDEAITRSIASFMGSLIALPVVNFALNNKFSPLELGILDKTSNIFIYEFIATFILTVAIMAMPKFGNMLSRPWIAVVFRGLDFFLNGPCMNPLIGLAYFTYNKQYNMLYSLEFLIGFTLAPTLGGIVALKLWKFIPKMMKKLMSATKSTTKSSTIDITPTRRSARSKSKKD